MLERAGGVGNPIWGLVRGGAHWRGVPSSPSGRPMRLVGQGPGKGLLAPTKGSVRSRAPVRSLRRSQLGWERPERLSNGKLLGADVEDGGRLGCFGLATAWLVVGALVDGDAARRT
jgi:hypothetical protein